MMIGWSVDFSKEGKNASLFLIDKCVIEDFSNSF